MAEQPIKIIRNEDNELALQFGGIVLPMTRDTAATLHARLDYYLNQGMAVNELEKLARERGELRVAGERDNRKAEA